ncbi:TIGR03364 family FAD-dependent oxidoreductase [Microbulbifer pacificus]|uniref:TIGR03364 family FAD-dependent oxidoreductase n=1 Tax=Microbulbifer pacificus TaxID=407164 RepID=A0AAU0MWF1_9GAMM|nr:TIGR03364 family FAD-dependent oxidoreductase [Microbulbifer pacificus]WOX04985.1 TIGR03364 family FAD-dependent oxidoreductase [Microbulbifer pacificus]
MKFDLAIVGAGVLGSFAALEALRKGKRVLLLDAGVIARGATVRNFGQLVPSGMALGPWRELGIRSLSIYRQLQPMVGGAIWQQGSTYIASTPEEAMLLEEMHAIDCAHNYRSQLLTPNQCMEKMPALRAEYCHGGLYYPDEMSAESGQLMPRLWSLLSANPALTLRPGTLVRDIRERDGSVEILTSSNESLRADQALICCGHLLNQLYPDITQHDQMKLCKLQMLRSESVPGIRLPGNLLTGLSIRRYEAFHSCPSYPVLPQPVLDPRYGEFGIHMLFRQSADGSIIIGDSHEYFPANDVTSIDYEVREDINQLMLEEARNILKLPHWRMTSCWNGYYSQDMSGQKVLLRSVSEKIHLVTGIGGKGMTTGPALMQNVVQQLLRGEALTLPREHSYA